MQTVREGLHDVVSPNGLVWRTWRLGAAGFRRADDEPWYGFGGGWGSDAESSPGSSLRPFWGR